MSLSPDLMSRCRQALLKCDKFDSADALKTVFSVRNLASFQNKLPDAKSREDRVDKLITFLMDRKEEGRFALISFFRVLLHIYISPEDSLYGEIEHLSIEVEYECSIQEDARNYQNTNYEKTYFGNRSKSSKKLIEITRCLLKFHYMQEGSLIEGMLRLLPAELTQNIPVNGQEIGFSEIYHIVETCTHHPDVLEKLAYALYQKEGMTPQWQTLDALLRSMSEKTVTYTRLQQLQSILAEITWPDKVLRKAYTVSLPDGWINNSDDHLPTIVGNLAAIPCQSEGTYPILIFAQYLLYYAQQHREISIQNDLSTWLRERVQELELNTAQVSILHDKVKRYCSSSIYYLLITLDPENESSFCIQAWLLDSEGNPISNAGIEVENEPVPLEQIPTTIDLLLEKCEGYLADDVNKLIVELALPISLLCSPVDHWPVSNGIASVKLGIQHKMVVRSLERIRKTRMLAFWKSKWNTFQELLNTEGIYIADKGLIWICDRDQHETHESLYAILHATSIICLALTFAPFDNITDTSDILTATLGSGIPIALWPRKSTSHPQAIRDLFTSFLSPQTLAQIPDLVWKQRNAAGRSKDEQHQGHHLTLLWDDPNRLPPSRQLIVPSVRRRT